MAEQLLIVGASARAVIQSAMRGGWTCCAIDLFADSDVPDCCPVLQMQHYPTDVTALASKLTYSAWLYTGAFENYPELLNQLAEKAPLLGNGPAVLSTVRNPFELQQIMRTHGLRWPDTRTNVDPLDKRPWLVKPYRSSAGSRITRKLPVTSDHSPPPAFSSNLPETHFLQEAIRGVPMSGLFVAADRNARLLGISQQLTGIAELGAREFQYCGNLYPPRVPESIVGQFEQIGAILTHACPLVGAFGVDAIVHQEEVWPVEVNPRLTSAIDLLDRRLSTPWVQLHVQACQAGTLPDRWQHTPTQRWCGKAIQYFTGTSCIEVNQKTVNRMLQLNQDRVWPQVADIPRPGTRINPGQPMYTVFASGRDRADVLQRLLDRSGQMLRWLEET